MFGYPLVHVTQIENSLTHTHVTVDLTLYIVIISDGK